MNLNGLMTMLADATPAAPAGPAGQQQGLPPWANIVPFALIGVMLVVLFTSQSKKAKQQAEMLKTVKPGDKVATASGIIGTVVSVKEKSVALRSAESKLEVLKSAVTDILERGGDSGNKES
jgi:preprotein translocase subunit YajC